MHTVEKVKTLFFWGIWNFYTKRYSDTDFKFIIRIISSYDPLSLCLRLLCAATSFSHPFYLVMKEKAKKVGKSCHLGVIRHPPWFCTRATTEIRLLKKKLKFEAFHVFLHAQTPSQWIRHEKLHKNRHQERPNRSIFKDFKLS